MLSLHHPHISQTPTAGRPVTNIREGIHNITPKCWRKILPLFHHNIKPVYSGTEGSKWDKCFSIYDTIMYHHYRYMLSLHHPHISQTPTAGRLITNSREGIHNITPKCWRNILPLFHLNIKPVYSAEKKTILSKDFNETDGGCELRTPEPDIILQGKSYCYFTT